MIPHIVKQVEDDPELLDLMLHDTMLASDQYKPTNYWLNYEKEILPEIKTLGLHDFRRRHSLNFVKFGATDLEPYNIFLNLPPTYLTLRILQLNLRASLKLRKILARLSNHVFDVNLSLYHRAKSYGEKNGARPISEFEASPDGNPENLFDVNGKMYTVSLLDYYVQYAYCCRFMNFDSIKSTMELGCGSGKQAEVIKKLHPHMCFYLSDLPHALYICEKYLASLFPESVVSYRQTRLMKRIPEAKEGKIFIIGNWKIPEFENLNYDLFWNSDSLDQMEPEIVLNYLKYVNQQSTKYVFLNERLTKGVHRTAKKGEQGVLKQTKLEHYKQGLSNFRLVDMSMRFQMPKILPWTSYEFSFWKRK